MLPLALVAEAPKITDWLQTAVSSLSLIVSSGALIATAVLVRHELSVRREEASESLAAQARAITPSITSGKRTSGGRLDRVTVHWEVRNDSEHPITRLRVGILPARNASASLEALMSPMGQTVLAPGEVHEGISAFYIRRGLTRKPGSRLAMLHVYAEFLDSRGYWWRRVGDRRPRRECEELLLTERASFMGLIDEMFDWKPPFLRGKFVDIELLRPVEIHSVDDFSEEPLDDLGIRIKTAS